MTDYLDQADEFTLVRRQLGMMRPHGSTKKGQRPFSLMKDHTDARPRRIAIHNEGPGKIWQL
jgi:hypothetical protein